MKKLTSLTLLICFSLSWLISAQDTFYYHNDGKIPLPVFPGKLVAISPLDNPQTLPADIFTPVDTIKSDNSFICTYKYDSAKYSDAEALTLAGQTEENKYSVQSCYLYEGYMELAPCGVIDVKLKKEEDFELLKSTAEQHNLVIDHQDTFMPLWYTLYQSAKSTKGSVEVANAMHETNLFASSQPSFVFDAFEDINTPSSINDRTVENTATIRGVDGAIEISNAEAMSYEIYASGGQLVAQGVATNATTIPLPKGVYIVKLGQKSHKISI